MTLVCQVVSSMDDDFFPRFKNRVLRERIPLSGSIELTTRCNFSCVHCYLPTNSRKNPAPDADSGRVLSWIDDLAEAGCLYLLLTGGEPLLRKDFSDIYTHARKQGMMVSVFTNGSTVTDEHLRLFKEYPPTEIEISVYGASPETYKRITGSANAYSKAMAGIDALHGNGVRIKLKTVLMDLNHDDLPAIEDLARKLGVGFRFDPAVMPRLDGDRSPILHRVSPEAAVECEFRDADRFKKWAAFWKKTEKTGIDAWLYVCGAGMTCFHITASGLLQPCLMSTEGRHDLNQSDFRTGWASMGEIISRIKAGSQHPCKGCELITICGYCPPFFKLETGSEHIRSDFLCRIGHIRLEKIMNDGVLNKDG